MDLIQSEMKGAAPEITFIFKKAPSINLFLNRYDHIPAKLTTTNLVGITPYACCNFYRQIQIRPIVILKNMFRLDDVHLIFTPTAGWFCFGR